MAATAGYSKDQVREAERLVAIADRWAEGRRHKDGVRFNIFASRTRRGVYHYTRFDGGACTCEGARESKTGRCFHQLACRLQTERVQEEAARPKRPTYEDLWQGDGDQLTDAF